MTDENDTPLYEWDSAKEAINVDDHGYAFDVAAEVFDGETFTKADTRIDYGEPRLITAGFLRQRMVLVVHTPRGDATRIISLRNANQREQRMYTERLQAQTRGEAEAEFPARMKKLRNERDDSENSR